MKEVLKPEKQIVSLLESYRDHPVRVDEEREIQFLEGKRDEILERLILPIAGNHNQGFPVPRIGLDLLERSYAYAIFLPRSTDEDHGSKIVFNLNHYMMSKYDIFWSRGKWNQMEALAHELVHYWQFAFDSGKPSHGRDFVNFSSRIGLHVMPELGFHTAVAGWPLSKLMKHWNYPRPEYVKQYYAL